MTERQDITGLLRETAAGDPAAMQQLLPVVYAELRHMAGRSMGREHPGHTLQATALVHEAYLRLIDQRQVEWQNRAHFFAIAAQAIRRVLVDHAKGKRRKKRDSGGDQIELDESLLASYGDAVDVVALDEAMQRLAETSPQQARIVEMRFFGGLTIEETAHVMGISTSTVERDWRFARASLFRVLSGD